MMNIKLDSSQSDTYPFVRSVPTTPSDLARFAIEIQQSSIGKQSSVLSKEMVDKMLTPQAGGWGLGLQLLGSGESARFAHNGSNKGFKCLMFAYEKTGQGAVVMTNADQGLALATEIFESISKEYRWGEKL
jgi:hypothetical protein